MALLHFIMKITKLEKGDEMKRFVCLDLEMSELTVEQKQMICGLRNEIIQIGAVMLDENYNMISEFNTYVKPCYSSVTQSIKELTGITNEGLENADDFLSIEDFSSIDSPLSYLAEESSFISLCDKYHVLKSKVIKFATDVMDTQEMLVV